MRKDIKISSLLLVILLAGCAAVKKPTDSEKMLAYLAYSDGYWQVWSMTPSGNNPRQVTHSKYDKNRVSWYLDGKYILLNGNQGELFRVNIKTGQEQPVKSEMSGMNDAVISPNGKYIAYSLSTASSVDDNNIWVMNEDGTKPYKLTNMKALQHWPVWDSNSENIYFVSGDGGQTHDIWKVSLSNKKREQITVNNLYHFDIAVSKNNQLAFSSNRNGNYDIWVQEARNTPPSNLTNHPALDGKSTWSPDGKEIIFESSRDGVINLWKMSASGGKAVKISNHLKGARAPVWYAPAGGAR